MRSYSLRNINSVKDKIQNIFIKPLFTYLYGMAWLGLLCEISRFLCNFVFAGWYRALDGLCPVCGMQDIHNTNCPVWESCRRELCQSHQAPETMQHKVTKYQLKKVIFITYHYSVCYNFNVSSTVLFSSSKKSRIGWRWL